MAGVAARAVLVLPFTDAADAAVVPALTLAINLAGSFLLGIVLAAAGDGHDRWRAFAGTGVLGGFTTYSAFAVQAVQVAGAAPVIGLLLIVLTLFGGVLAAAAGVAVGSRRTGPSAP